MLFFLLISILAFHSFAHETFSHVVKDKECLSQIAYQYCQKIYGKDGFINQIKKLNPVLRRKPDLVFPGKVLSIPSIELCLSKWPQIEKEEKTIAVPEIFEPPKNLESNEVSHGDYFTSANLSYKIIGSSSILDANSLSYKRIKGVSLISKPIFGVNIGRRFNYSNQTQHIIFGGLKFEDYYGSKNVNVNSSSVLRSNLGFGVEHEINTEHTLRLNAGAEERTVIDESVYNQINLEKVLVPYIGVNHSYVLKNSLKQKFELLSHGRYLSESELLGLKVRPGYELGLGMSYKLLKSRFPTEWLLNLSRLEQSTSVTRQTEWCFGVNYSVNFSTTDN
jgi:hypothetical protein